MSEKQQVSVAIQSVGEAEVIAGLMVLQALDQVEIEALGALVLKIGRIKQHPRWRLPIDENRIGHHVPHLL